MRRDPRDGAEAGSDDELLAAYVDGVSELAPAERRALEARLASEPSLRTEADETRALLGRLRELPPSYDEDAGGCAGGEPDWAAMERAIHEAVGPVVPRPWWRRIGWRWIAPAAALATAAALAVLVLDGPEPELAAPSETAGRERAPQYLAPRGDELTMALWLDGEDIEIELAAEALLVMPWEADAGDEELPVSELAWSDLAWVDELDADALERAEEYLKEPAMAPVQRRKPG